VESRRRGIGVRGLNLRVEYADRSSRLIQPAEVSGVTEGTGRGDRESMAVDARRARRILNAKKVPGIGARHAGRAGRDAGKRVAVLHAGHDRCTRAVLVRL